MVGVGVIIDVEGNQETKGILFPMVGDSMIIIRVVHHKSLPKQPNIAHLAEIILQEVHGFGKLEFFQVLRNQVH